MSHDLRVRTFSSSAEVLKTGRRPTWSCLVLERDLPGASWIDLVRQLESRGELSPAIILTDARDVVHSTAWSRRRIEFLPKPIEPGSLVELVNDALDR